MDYEKKYKEALERAKSFYYDEKTRVGMTPIELEYIFPELQESEDERIRKDILAFITREGQHIDKYKWHKWIAWLEKQGQSKKTSIWKHWKNGIAGNGDGIPVFLIKNGSTYSLSSCFGFECDYIELSELDNLMLKKQGNITELSEEEQNRFAKGVLSSCALSFIDYLDAHKYEGKMCVFNGECEDIENAFHNAMWDKLHRYYCKYIEKQSERKYTKKDVDDAYLKGISDTKNEIEKQYEANYQIRKDIATFIFNYRGDIKDRAKWMDYLGIKVSFVENNGEQPQGKSALEAIKEEKVDNANKKESEETFGDVEQKVFDDLLNNGEQMWSEDDENNFQGIIDEIEANKNEAPDYDVKTYNKFLKWLKSLKQRLNK